MATTYTGIFGTRILPGLERLLEAEFKGTAKLYVSDEYVEKGSESIRLADGGSEQITVNSNSETRLYRIDGTYYINMKPCRERTEAMARRIARINRIVLNNQHYVVSTIYQWHNAKISLWEKGDLEEGEPADYGRMRFQFECTATENIS